MRNFSKVFIVVALLALLVAPAALAYIPTPSPEVTGTPITLSEVQSLIRLAAQFLITMSMVIAVIFIVWGGITYMFAGGDETKAKEARTRILNGIIGAAVILGVGFILQTVASVFDRGILK